MNICVQLLIPLTLKAIPNYTMLKFYFFNLLSVTFNSARHVSKTSYNPTKTKKTLNISFSP